MNYRGIVRCFWVLPVFAVALLGDTLAESQKEVVLLQPGEPYDYSTSAFYLDKWEKRKLSTNMIPWEGEHLVFLTWTDSKKQLDPKIVSAFVLTLENGWRVYREIMPDHPKRRRTAFGHPYIAALPAPVTCGYGCGFIGETGIEVCGFYDKDYDEFAKDPTSFRHYYFYEMGRNWYTLGRRHDLCTTGFAVYMRYVCMDRLKRTDPELGLRKIIESSESAYAKSSYDWFDVFVKRKYELKDADGKPLPTAPSDTNSLYASMMLKLTRDHGPNFPKLFYHALAQCPEYDKSKLLGQVGQATNWAIAACAAARKDIAPMLVERWKFPLEKKTLRVLSEIDWTTDDAIKTVLKTLDP